MNAANRFGAWMVAILLIWPAGLFGQAFVQQGNALDANPRVGSGGLNYGARQFSPNAANRIVTGNVAGGLSFRGYSPIRDPSSLFFTNYTTVPVAGTSGGLTNETFITQSTYGLPSERLNSFNRESVSVANIRQGLVPGRYGPTPYYSPSGTVANTGAIIAGLNRPGTSELISPYMVPRPDLRIAPANPLEAAGGAQASPLEISPRLVRVDTGRPLTGPVNERLLGSRLFGAVREVPINALAAQAQSEAGGALRLPIIDRRLYRTEEPDLDELTRPRPEAAPEGEETPDEMLLGIPAGALRAPRETGRLAGTGDVDGLRRRTGGTLARPLTEPEAVAQAGAEPQPEGLPADRELPGGERTFTGPYAATITRLLEEAEGLLAKGQYYRAADRYALAQTIDPGIPQPPMGRAAALLAAGDYMSSANAIFTTIRLFGERTPTRLELLDRIPDEQVLAERRTDLEQRLQVFDDFRLRFLLGMVQYSTGQREAGLENMEQAAGRAPAEFSAVREYVERLKTAPADQNAPATRPGR